MVRPAPHQETQPKLLGPWMLVSGESLARRDCRASERKRQRKTSVQGPFTPWVFSPTTWSARHLCMEYGVKGESILMDRMGFGFHPSRTSTYEPITKLGAVIIRGLGDLRRRRSPFSGSGQANSIELWNFSHGIAWFPLQFEPWGRCRRKIVSAQGRGRQRRPRRPRRHNLVSTDARFTYWLAWGRFTALDAPARPRHGTLSQRAELLNLTVARPFELDPFLHSHQSQLRRCYPARLSSDEQARKGLQRVRESASTLSQTFPRVLPSCPLSTPIRNRSLPPRAADACGEPGPSRYVQDTSQ
ncbi:hypothetical protein F4780DRAFT_445071 [Xylariomycetidae sp. FL0641]|nr:hypothetical protein F4780DRAFT_445071 [Xylariomycetidae sp. FL0641]